MSRKGHCKLATFLWNLVVWFAEKEIYQTLSINSMNFKTSIIIWSSLVIVFFLNQLQVFLYKWYYIQIQSISNNQCGVLVTPLDLGRLLKNFTDYFRYIYSAKYIVHFEKKFQGFLCLFDAYYCSWKWTPLTSENKMARASIHRYLHNRV